VFALLTDPEKLLRWMGTEAQVEPQPGGLVGGNVDPGIAENGRELGHLEKRVISIPFFCLVAKVGLSFHSATLSGANRSRTPVVSPAFRSCS